MIRAIKDQAENFIHSGCIFYYESLVRLAEKLRSITPPGIDRFFFSNSRSRGSGRGDKACALPHRQAGDRLVHRRFSQRAFGAMSLTTSNIKYRRRYHPLLPSVYQSPYPYCYRCFFRPECGFLLDGMLWILRTPLQASHPS